MAYALHLKRPNGTPIGLEEWSAVVAATAGLRLMTQGASIRNPRTRETIHFPHNPGDVEVFVEEEGEWVPGLQYGGNRISFRAPKDFKSDTPFRRLIFDLAARLGAQVVGDEGEVYTP